REVRLPPLVAAVVDLNQEGIASALAVDPQRERGRGRPVLRRIESALQPGRAGSGHVVGDRGRARGPRGVGARARRLDRRSAVGEGPPGPRTVLEGVDHLRAPLLSGGRLRGAPRLIAAAPREGAKSQRGQDGQDRSGSVSLHFTSGGYY